MFPIGLAKILYGSAILQILTFTLFPTFGSFEKKKMGFFSTSFNYFFAQAHYESVTKRKSQSIVYYTFTTLR
jgi:hypothetical protein